MTLPYQKTIGVRTYVKTALIEALRSAFANHPDETLRDVKIHPEFSFEETDYPSVVVSFRPRTNTAAGVGHIEYLRDPVSNAVVKATRRFYKGDVEFHVYALSTLDRDLISDSLTQILSMSRFLAWTNAFEQRIYEPERWAVDHDPDDTMGDGHLFNFLNLNTDLITETGDTESPNPWGAEDVLLYQSGQMIPVFGEVLTMPPETTWTVIEQVLPYPYLKNLEPVPTGTVDDAPWIPVYRV